MPLSLAHLQEWFLRYAGSFSSPDPGIEYNLCLKKDHSLRVRSEMREIVAALGLTAGDATLAETIALLHDIGRFEQYANYKTFVDRKSVDHAKLGAGIIRDSGVLRELPEDDFSIVQTAIELHNRAGLPHALPERQMLFCRLIRDADKLDILHLLIDHYRDAGRKNRSAVELSLPHHDTVSPDAIAALMRRETVNFSHVRNGNDFKLLQMSWVFDVNFAPALRKIRERNFLGQLRDTLPNTGEVKKAYEFVERELERRLLPLADRETA